MSEDSATERARALLAERFADVSGTWTPERFGTDRRLLADHAVAALARDPDLLVDLALEAGGLEQVGWCSPSMADGPNIGSLIDGKYDESDEPVYRRKEQSQ